MTSSLPLHTDRLVLRTYREDDDVWMQRVYSRPEVARYLLDDPWDTDLTATRLADRLAKTDIDGPTGTLALVIEYDGEPVGDIMIWFSDRVGRCAEIGWVLDPDHGGKGLAAEAVRAVLDYGTGPLRLHRVVAQMDARNTASAKLARGVGMRQEAHFLQNWWNKGEWTDTLVFAVLGDR